MKERKWFGIWHRHNWNPWRVEDIEVSVLDRYHAELWMSVISDEEPPKQYKRIQERRCKDCGLRQRRPL